MTRAQREMIRLYCPAALGVIEAAEKLERGYAKYAEADLRLAPAKHLSNLEGDCDKAADAVVAAVKQMLASER